jgi:hypothetical protein
MRSPAPPAKAAAADPLGALGKLSFRQLLTLSQASENLQPKGSTKAPSTTDAAGAALASIYQQQFKRRSTRPARTRPSSRPQSTPSRRRCCRSRSRATPPMSTCTGASNAAARRD